MFVYDGVLIKRSNHCTENKKDKANRPSSEGSEHDHQPQEKYLEMPENIH